MMMKFKINDNERPSHITYCMLCDHWMGKCAPEEFPSYIKDLRHCEYFKQKKINGAGEQ